MQQIFCILAWQKQLVGSQYRRKKLPPRPKYERESHILEFCHRTLSV
ncbi:Protein of unknown function [Pyronema omphalodes CBS 100304]|uniref:Uncharacterized protein n=1 Tax=Pyronema omphalodes (strain CBS 100304) TaxID=1076935 RepID=U4LFZ5_PYROM|nr:Protein of unknown function [Pyronema omphalodes CBS 100304]